MNQQHITTHINLIRHGETNWNVEHRYQGSTDTPLNDLGRKQVTWLADSIRGETWDVIYSSPSVRAFDTARGVAVAIGIDEDAIIKDRNLMERAYGEAEGMTLPEREARWPEGDWPGLETWEEVAERVMKTLRSAVQDNSGKRILVICHGGVINAILATISEGEIGTGKTVIDNTSRTTLDVNGDVWTIGDVNNIDHLKSLATAD